MINEPFLKAQVPRYTISRMVNNGWIMKIIGFTFIYEGLRFVIKYKDINYFCSY